MNDKNRHFRLTKFVLLFGLTDQSDRSILKLIENDLFYSESREIFVKLLAG